MEHQRIFDQELDELKEMILKMGSMVQSLIEKSIEALKLLDSDLAQKVILEDENIDQMELEIDEKCIQLIALRQPEASDLRFLTTGMRISTDLERIGDMAEDIAHRTIELTGQPLLKPLVDIPEMAKLDQESLMLVLKAFVEKNPEISKPVWEKEKEVDKLRDLIHDELVEIMNKDAKTVPRAVPLLLISRHLERISDHLTNIEEDILYMVEGKVIKHGGPS